MEGSEVSANKEEHETERELHRERTREIDRRREVNGSFPWDVRGSRVPWRAAGRVHGVFRVVLRYTVVGRCHLCVVGVAK